MSVQAVIYRSVDGVKSDVYFLLVYVKPCSLTHADASLGPIAVSVVRRDLSEFDET